jgi:hypothetical protein
LARRGSPRPAMWMDPRGEEEKLLPRVFFGKRQLPQSHFRHNILFLKKSLKIGNILFLKKSFKIGNFLFLCYLTHCQFVFIFQDIGMI